MTLCSMPGSRNVGRRSVNPASFDPAEHGVQVGHLTFAPRCRRCRPAAHRTAEHREFVLHHEIGLGWAQVPEVSEVESESDPVPADDVPRYSPIAWSIVVSISATTFVASAVMASATADVILTPASIT